MEVGLGRGHIVLDGDPALPSQKGHSPPPNFRHGRCGQTAEWIKMALSTEVGRVPGHIALDEDPPVPKKGQSPQFSTHVYCGLTARWIKMPLGTEVGLSPGYIVLDGDPSPPKRVQPPIFGPCLLWPNGWMDQDATWYGGRSRPRRHCVRWGPRSPKGHSPLIFGSSVVAKRLDGRRCHFVRRLASAQAILC